MKSPVAILNFKYRLYPTPEQARHLGRAMFRMRWAWNQIILRTKRAQALISAGVWQRGEGKSAGGKRTLVCSRLAKIVSGRGLSGRRVEKLEKLKNGALLADARKKLQELSDKIRKAKEDGHHLECDLRKATEAGNGKRIEQSRKRLKKNSQQVARNEQRSIWMQRRIAKLEALAALASCGDLTEEAAGRALRADDLESIYQLRDVMLAKEFAEESVDATRKAMWGGSFGNLFGKLVLAHDKAWKACLSQNVSGPRRGAPRFKKAKDATGIAFQVQGGTVIRRPAPVLPDGWRWDVSGIPTDLSRNGAKRAWKWKSRDNFIRLSPAFPKRFQPNQRDFTRSSALNGLSGRPRQEALRRLRAGMEAITWVKFREHRPLPAGAVVKDIKVLRDAIRGKAEWHVVLAVEVPDEAARKDYARTGRSCGLDPGVKTPLTMFGEDMEIPGLDGEEMGPGRPFARAARKVRRIQRKLDRQRRANNPDCFDDKGVWKKGKRLSAISAGMKGTEAALRAESHRVARIREASWQQVVDSLLGRYDTVYLGDWRDSSPDAKGKARRKRKAAFEEDGTKRAKGVAARERTTNRNNRDNALGRFQQLLVEKAQRARGKSVFLVKEGMTTRACYACGAVNPALTKQSGLSIRFWVCPACGQPQDRDRGAAYKILRKGQTDPGAVTDLLAEPRKKVTANAVKAAAQAVKGRTGNGAPVARVSPKGSRGLRGKGVVTSDPLGRGVREAPRSVRGPSAGIGKESRSTVHKAQHESCTPVEGFASGGACPESLGPLAESQILTNRTFVAGYTPPLFEDLDLNPDGKRRRSRQAS